MADTVRKMLVSVLGLGYVPGIRGTYGSFGGVVAFVLITFLVGDDRLGVVWAVTAVLAAVGCVVAVTLGRWAVRFYDREDPPVFVLDEAVGMWVALVAVPFAGVGGMAAVVMVQFVLFRIADIVKPQPARWAEGLADGWGILTDDVIAGIYANVVGQVVFRMVV